MRLFYHDTCTILEPSAHFELIFHGFEASPDVEVRHLFVLWKETYDDLSNFTVLLMLGDVTALPEIRPVMHGNINLIAIYNGHTQSIVVSPRNFSIILLRHNVAVLTR